MNDISFRHCGTDACLSVAAAKAALKDHVKLAEWMAKATNLIDYYERVTPDAPAPVRPSKLLPNAG